ncbi:MAG: hypothetical protein KFH98_16575, partial [Gemmatimonadetes bacterium]|nr:hypothetical protein [Gemmatimonadota bacterium]
DALTVATLRPVGGVYGELIFDNLGGLVLHRGGVDIGPEDQARGSGLLVEEDLLHAFDGGESLAYAR